MAEADEFDAFVAALQAKQAPSDPLARDTDELKARFVPASEPMAEAARADLTGLSSLDPSNPRNLPNILHHGIPIALQALLAGRGGLGVAQGVGRITQAARAGLGSLLGYGYQEGVEPLARGEAPTATPGGAALSFGLGSGFDTAVQAGGGMMRSVTGKRAMLAEGEAAAEKAALKAGGAQERALAKVDARHAALNQMLLKHSDDTMGKMRDDELRSKVTEFLGAPSPLDNPTLESLSERVAPVRETAERGVRSAFKNVSAKFEEKLTPYYDLPVSGGFANAVDSERAILDSANEKVSSTFGRLLDEVAGLDQGGGFNVSTLPPQFRDLYERVAAREGKERAENLVQRAIKGSQNAPALEAAKPTDVRDVDKVRSKLVGVIIGRGSPVEKRAAGRLVGAIDESLEPVLPENVRADWSNLRREWREANNVFSGQFRSKLFRADTPAKVADVLIGGARGDKAHRVLTVLRETPADEKPLLRSAFAERLTQGNVLKNVEGIDQRVWRDLFGDSGFKTPQDFVEATSRNLTEKFGLSEVMARPELAAKYNARFNEGLRSLGVKKASAAVARAEEVLRRTPDPGKVIADARTAGEMSGMREPLMGKAQSWLEHHHAYKTSIALMTLGSIGGSAINHPIAGIMAPLVYIGGSRGIAAALSSPKWGPIYHNLLKAKNYEQAGFWLGRLAAASLTEGGRTVSEQR